ncbi:MAG: type VI secretion system membrane subunit TssM [Burkholderiales bacterium]|nr:type VI secretion system membrane subunit TssM [Burkholderiales bacterium]
MLRRLLGLVFNRWLLAALLLALLIALVWIVGPLLAIGSWRPLDGPVAPWVATAVLVAAAAALLAWRLWRARRANRKVVDQLMAAPAATAPAESADMAAVREHFASALQTLRRARFGGSAAAPASRWQRWTRGLTARYLYELPWYLIIGAPGAGKTTALRNAGLRFPLAAQTGERALRGVGGTRNCDWWFTDQAVLIDTAGRFTTQDSDQATDRATWSGFLALLKSSRARQPLNGVLVTVSVAELLARSAAERAAHAAKVRERLQELHEQLAVRLPVYLLVTKCDLLAGFVESFEALDREARATPWGFTFDPAPGTWQQAFGVEFDTLQARLDGGLLERLQAEPDPPRRARVYGFPAQFATLRAPLREFVEQVFAPSPFEAEPMLRGVYFVSGTQEGNPIDRVLGAVARRYRLEHAVLPALQASGRSYFLQRLLTEVVFAEHGLAGTDRRWERRRGLAIAGGYALLGLAALGLLVAWTVSWRGNRAYVDAVASRVEEVRALVQATPNRSSADLLAILPALEATRALAAAGLAGVPGTTADAGVNADRAPWSLRFGLYQGRRLDGAARNAYERMLVDAMLPRLALRVEEQLRAVDQPAAQYESLKAYLMLYDPAHFDAAALKAHVERDWEARLGRELSTVQREDLSRHLDALLAQGPAAPPLPQDEALVQATRAQLAAQPLASRVYDRLRQRGLGEAFPEFDAVRAGGGNVPNVFTRASGLPLTRGVPGLYTYDGYHKGFQSVVDEVTRQLADEQSWVLGTESPASLPGDTARLVDDVRRLYLQDYRDTWKAYIADLRLQAVGSIAQSIEKTRFLAAPDNPLVPLTRAIARETTLLAGDAGTLARRAEDATARVRERVLGALGQRASGVAAGEREGPIERIVDDEFAALRRMVQAPEGGKAPIEGVVARLGELQVLLTAVDAALKGGGAPPPSPLPNQLRAEAANTPEPLRSLLETLGGASARVALMQLRETLSREVRTLVGEFCAQAITGRYPFDGGSPRDVTQADFAALFGPGGRFDQMQQRLAPYIDTGRQPWRFRPIDGTPLGSDLGTLPQFQRAAVIRETFFAAGAAGPALRMTLRPVEMDSALREFTLDVDGQIVRYAHGPQIPTAVAWPGPRGTHVVRVMVQPAAGAGMVEEGPWALMRLFERVQLSPGPSSERFRANFEIGGQRAVFDVTMSSVRSPFRLPELRAFACPQGL